MGNEAAVDIATQTTITYQVVLTYLVASDTLHDFSLIHNCCLQCYLIVVVSEQTLPSSDVVGKRLQNFIDGFVAFAH